MKAEIRQKIMIKNTVRGLLFALGGLLLVTGILLVLFPISYQVDATMEGIGWQLGEAAAEDPVTVQIKGVYHQYFFRDDVFEGDVHIEDVAYTDDEEWYLPPLVLKDGYGELTWFSQKRSLDSRHYGFIVADTGMNRIVIGRQGSAGDFGAAGSYLITAPAENHSDAVSKTAAVLKKHFSWLQKLDVSGEYT